MSPAALRFLSGWSNSTMLVICTNSPEPPRFCLVVPRGRLIASPTKGFAKTSPTNTSLRMRKDTPWSYNNQGVFFSYDSGSDDAALPAGAPQYRPSFSPPERYRAGNGVTTTTQPRCEFARGGTPIPSFIFSAGTIPGG